MKYRVIKYFTDLQDDEYPYNAGDTFPRKGMTVTADRIKELSSTANKRGVALIEEVRGTDETAEPDKAAPVENEPRKRARKPKNDE
jgi:hypothetical protein